MCVAATAKRRRKQAKNNFRHLAVHGRTPRPLYKKHDRGSVSDSISRARAQAAKEARMKSKPKG